jgi:glycosyltransferase involved in cell wall biosynthesis
MAFNVVVSHVAKHHAYQTALAAQENGSLKTFFTSFFRKKSPDVKQRLLTGIMPGRILSKIGNRTDPALNDDLVRSIYLPEMLEQSPLRGIMGHYNMMNLKSELFDRIVASRNLSCDIFHGFEGAVFHSMRKAKRQGAMTVLDQPIFYHETSRKILLEEYHRWKVSPPEFLTKDNVNIKRKQQEIASADYILVPTESIKKDFERINKKAFVTPYGFEPGRFFATPKTDSVFRIIMVGIMGYRKGVIYLLEAFKQLSLKNAELLLISPVDKDFKPMMAKYEHWFKHIHAVPNSELPAYYSNASVFVFPSLVEGSAYVTYEAMACGLPIIASENAGSVVRDGVDGFIVPIRDLEALKEKIVLLYENESLRKEMSHNSANHVKEFTWARYRRRLIEVYQEILNERRSN